MGAVSFGDVGQLEERRATGTSGHRGQANEEPPILLQVHSDVITRRGRDCRGGSVDQLSLQILGFQDLAELLDSPVSNQELQAGAGPQPPVAVVAEGPDHRRPDLRYLIARHPGAHPLGQHRVRREATADPEVKTWPVLGVLYTDKRDVVHFGGDVVVRNPGQRRLELAWQVRELRITDVTLRNIPDRLARIDDLVGCDACNGRTEDDSRAITTGFSGVQANRLEPPPDFRHVLNPDPVQLDILPIGDVGGVAGKVDGDLADHAQLLGCQRTAIDPYPEHEVLVVQLRGLQGRGLSAVDSRAPLSVEPVPAEAPPEVGRIDRREAALRVDVLDPLTDQERMVVLLGLLVGVERLAVAQGPLALALLPTRGRRTRRPGWTADRLVHGFGSDRGHVSSVGSGRRPGSDGLLQTSGARWQVSRNSEDTSSTWSDQDRRSGAQSAALPDARCRGVPPGRPDREQGRCA